MVSHLQAEMAALLMQTPWMDGPTKNLAFKKFDKMVSQVGYPDKWRNYDGLKVGRSYLENRLEAISFENSYEWAKIGKPVDRSDWGMTPSMVNAAFEPQINRIIFPAGILQPPFFNVKFPAYANYAAIGMVIGHEMTHAFDDSGSQFNGDGAVVNWWSEASSREFRRRAQCLAHQFDQFPTVGNGHVNGALTLGEDIGDQGGLKLAYNAWKAGWPEAWKKNEPAAREESKKFFLSFAQAWCGKDSEEFEKVRINRDPHPPNRYRVKGALMNFPDFAKTYQCKAGAPMAPKEQCSVW
jgi:predicted metalloendopeptidase